MPLFVGRRYPVIEVELILAEPGTVEGEAVSVTEGYGELYIILYNPVSVSDTDGSMVTNFLIASNTISEGIASGDLLRTFELGETISDDSLAREVYIFISGTAYSDDVNSFTPVFILEQEAISEIDTLGNLLRTYELGEAQSDTDAEFRWFSTWYPGETVSEIDNSFSWIFEYIGEAISETYSSWIVSTGLGNAVSETDGEYEFAGKSLHDLIELDDTINRTIIATTGVVRIVELEAYLIRK